MRTQLPLTVVFSLLSAKAALSSVSSVEIEALGVPRIKLETPPEVIEKLSHGYPPTSDSSTLLERAALAAAAVHGGDPAGRAMKRPRFAARQVTRQQLIERAIKKQLNARSPNPLPAPQAPPPAASPTPLQTITIATGYIDDEVFPLPAAPPFDVMLFGKPYPASSIQVSSNGFLRFGVGSNRHTNAHLPMKGVGNVAIFPYMDDLVIPNGNFKLSYTYNNKGFTVDWQTIPYASLLITDYIHFQLSYDVDHPNLLTIRWLADSNPLVLTGNSATIGVQSVTDEIVYEYSYNNKKPGGGNVPLNARPAPGRSLIIDTLTGGFSVVG